MGSINLLSLFWAFASLAVICANLLQLHDILFFKSLYLWGKLKKGSQAQVSENELKSVFLKLFSVITSVPKSWFSHFYVVGTAVHSLIFASLMLHLLGLFPPYLLKDLCGLFHWGDPFEGSKGLGINAWPVLLVFSLEWLQIARRMYECLFISSFSNSTISVVHYFFGVFLYCSFGIGLLSSVQIDKLSLMWFPNVLESLSYLSGMSLFSWASYHQHKSMLSFASLRIQKKDKKASGHYIPHGHLFELVSSPHYFCEILLYLSFCVIFQFRNWYLLSVLVFVLTNQVLAAISVHKWYQETFPSYPSSRKAIIPYFL